MFNAAPWLRGDIFDAVMNYRFADAMLKYFVDTQNNYDSTPLPDRLQLLLSEYPPEVSYVLMNLMDSHDTERLASMVVNPNRWIDHANNLQWNPEFEVRKPNPEEKKTQKLMIAFQMLYLGAPMIYYGDEAGMWGADDPDERKPMVWPDMAYEPEKSHPLGKPRPEDPVQFDNDLFNFYKILTAIRQDHRAIRRGDYQYAEVSQSPDVFAFTRSDGTQSILCIFNRASASQEVTLSERFVQSQFLYGGENLVPSSGGRLSIAGKSIAILVASTR
jgi:glycosidase